MSKIILLFWLHWFADFVLQSDWMALNKSTSIKPLTVHVSIYSAVFLVFGWRFAAITFVTHWITDFFTSKLNKRLAALPSKHWFFVGVGFDQAIHMTTLFLTLYYLVIM